MTTQSRLQDGARVLYQGRVWRCMRYRRAWLLQPLDQIDPYARDVFLRRDTVRQLQRFGQLRVEEDG